MRESTAEGGTPVGRTPRGRTWRIALAAASVVALLSGCVGIPTTSGVEIGRSIVEQDAGEVQFFPLGPAVDASQENILRGFIAAFSGLAGNYEVARQFLSTDFATEWDARSGVTVRSNVERFAPVDSNTMSYTINAAGSVDATGVYRENVQPTAVTLEFRFVQEDGQWRISEAPAGTILADAQFQSIFDEHALYFFDPTLGHLVPDARWFETATAPLRIVSSLLEGPPPALAGAVVSAFPPGTRLAKPSVDVQSGTAEVDLSPEALTADTRSRQLMRLQLESSLDDVAGVEDVALSVSGTRLQIGSASESLPASLSRVDARPVVFRPGEFGYLSVGAITPIDGLAPGLTAVGAVAGTFDANASRVVALGAAGVWDISGAEPEGRLIDGRSGLIAPTVDEYGAIWTAVGSDAGSLRRTEIDGTASDVQTGLGADDDLVSIDVSRDGTRMALAVQTSAGARLIIQAIQRDGGSGSVTGLGQPLLDATVRGDAVDATWTDDLAVAFLTSVQQVPAATVFRIGGSSRALGSPEGGVAIVGGNGEAGLRVLTAAGGVLGRSGNGWTAVTEGVGFIATQR